MRRSLKLLALTETEASVGMMTLTPTYENCYAVINGNKLEATVTFHSCYYTLAVEKEEVIGAYTHVGKVSLLCPGAKEEVEVHAYASEPDHEGDKPTCTWAVPPKNDLSVMNYATNAAFPNDMNQNWDFTVPYNRKVGAPAFCGVASGFADYEGTTTVTAKNNKGTAVALEVTGK